MKSFWLALYQHEWLKKDLAPCIEHNASGCWFLLKSSYSLLFHTKWKLGSKHNLSRRRLCRLADWALCTCCGWVACAGLGDVLPWLSRRPGVPCLSARPPLLLFPDWDIIRLQPGPSSLQLLWEACTTVTCQTSILKPLRCALQRPTHTSSQTFHSVRIPFYLILFTMIHDYLCMHIKQRCKNGWH